MDKMDKKGEMDNTEPYTIINGFFKSTLTSSKVIEEYTRDGKALNGKALNGKDRIMIGRSGDTLLRVWTDTGTDFKFKIGDCPFESVNGEVKLFEGGLPLIGQYGGYIFIYTDTIDKVYAEFENYENIWRNRLARFHEESPSDKSKGVKLRRVNSEKPDYIIGGREDPGHSVNTLYRLDD